MSGPDAWVRAHIKGLRPYSTAREDYDGEAGRGDRLYLDANESPYAPELQAPQSVASAVAEHAALNRYPDPHCQPLRAALSDWLGVEPEVLWMGNGSDEALDLILRTFVEPGEPVVICAPTYAMYGITARAHGAQVREVPLNERFDLDVLTTLAAAEGAKVIFLCSPNNPTANRLSGERVAELAARFDGLVVVDEAYAEFSTRPSLVPLAKQRRNVAVLRTLSKAWGLAAARVGYMVADPQAIEFIDRVNLPYPLSSLSMEAAARSLARPEAMEERVRRVLAERARLSDRLRQLGIEVLPSDANFLLVRLANATQVCERLASDYGIVVRDRGSIPRLENCLRISVGRPEDTDRLSAALKEILT